MYLPDLALAVHPQLVVTSQTVGDRAEIGLFDPNGDRIRTISTPAVRGGAITADGERFVFVTKGAHHAGHSHLKRPRRSWRTRTA